ncbi:MAG: hypothetical protein ABSC21_03210 [Terriglobia bacterium]
MYPLDELAIEEKEIVYVPETFQVSPHQIAAVECEQMIVRDDSIAFMAIPKHASSYVRQWRYHSPCSKQQLSALRPPASDPLRITRLLLPHRARKNCL